MTSSGVEWIVDAYDCDPLALASRERLVALVDRIVGDLQLTRLGEPIWHVFPDPGGMTGLILLSESHLTVHTFPEVGFAAMNLYSCQRWRHAWSWEAHLAETLGARRIDVRAIARGSSTVGSAERSRSEGRIEVPSTPAPRQTGPG